MSHPDFTFKLTKKVRVDADFHKHKDRATISCETNDGKSIHLIADFETLEKIHEQIQKRLESLWAQ